MKMELTRRFEHASQQFSLDGAVGTVTRLRTGQSGFDPHHLVLVPLKQNTSVFPETSRPALRTTQPHTQWVLEIISLRRNPSGKWSDKLSAPHDEATNEWHRTSIPPLCFGQYKTQER